VTDEIDTAYEQFIADQVANGRVCGSCELFTDEDLNGNGWCQFGDGGRHCDDTCRHWTAQAKK
jgi:hypothetical protein